MGLHLSLHSHHPSVRRLGSADDTGKSLPDEFLNRSGKRTVGLRSARRILLLGLLGFGWETYHF